MNDWPTTTLKRLVKIKYGDSLPNRLRAVDGKVPVFGSNGIVGRHDKAITRAPVIIIGRKGSVGAVNVSTEPCWPIDTAYYIDEFSNELSQAWAFLFLQTQDLAHLKQDGPKAGIRRDDIYEIEIPVPPLPEQRRLVARIEALTNRLEEAQQARQAALVEAETVFQRALEDAFADEITEDWREVAAEQLFEVVSGQFSPLDPRLKHLPYLGPEHIESGTGRIIGERRSVEELKMKSGKYLFTPDHVVYSKIRPALRKVCLPDYSGLCSADMYALKPNSDKVIREFLLFLLLAPPFSNYAVDNSDRNAMPKINRQALFGFAFRIPDKSEQQRIAKLLLTLRSKLDELQRLQREVDAELAAFAPALLAKAFRGEL